MFLTLPRLPRSPSAALALVVLSAPVALYASVPVYGFVVLVPLYGLVELWLVESAEGELRRGRDGAEGGSGGGDSSFGTRGDGDFCCCLSGVSFSLLVPVAPSDSSLFVARDFFWTSSLFISMPQAVLCGSLFLSVHLNTFY